MSRKVISQRELAEIYRNQQEYCRLRELLAATKKDLYARKVKGATVELGNYSASVRKEVRRGVSWKGICVKYLPEEKIERAKTFARKHAVYVMRVEKNGRKP